MIIPEIGECAGKIWHSLDDHGPMSIDQLEKMVEVKEPFVQFALGWLSRERKVHFYTRDNKLYVGLNANSEYFF